MNTRSIFTTPTVEITQLRYEELVSAEHELLLLKVALLNKKDYTDLTEIKEIFHIKPEIISATESEEK